MECWAACTLASHLDPCGVLLLLEDALCMQDHAEEESFSSECKEEVTRDQVRSNRDYRCPLRQCCTYALCFQFSPGTSHWADDRLAVSLRAGRPLQDNVIRYTRF